MSHEIIEAQPAMLGIKLEKPFPLGFGTLEHLPRVLLKISALEKGRIVSGIGEASIDFPFAPYDAWDIFWALSQLDLIGRSVDERRSVLEDKDIRKNLLNSFPAAFTALNMAIDDVYGKLNDEAITQIYGQRRKGSKALASIGFENDTALLITEIEGKVNKGFIPKPKVGRGVYKDAVTIGNVAVVCRERNVPFVLDFNAFYDPTQFAELIERLSAENVNLAGLIFIEQPTTEESGISGLVSARDVLRKYGYDIPVMADESFVTLENAIECSKKGILLNFKIHKVGGIFYAREIEEALKRELTATDKNIVGGTFPTAIGRSYDQHAAAVLETTGLPGDGWEPSTDWFSGERHLIEEKFISDKDKKEFMPFRGKGLGITPRWDKIQKFLVDDPRGEYRGIRFTGVGRHFKINLNNDKAYSKTYHERTGRNPDWNL